MWRRVLCCGGGARPADTSLHGPRGARTPRMSRCPGRCPRRGAGPALARAHGPMWRGRALGQHARAARRGRPYGAITALLAAECRPYTNDRLQITAHSWPSTTDRVLPAANYWPRTSGRVPPAAYHCPCVLLAAYARPPPPNRPLLIASCSAGRPTTRRLRMTAPGRRNPGSRVILAA